MSTQSKSKNTAYYINCLIFVAITFGVGFLPAFGQITPMGMKVLGVFLGLIYGWIFLGFVWPSLFGMLALGFTGYSNVLGVFSAAFGNNVVLQCFFVFVFVALLDVSGLTNFIAKWCVSRKICAGRPWVLTALFFVASFLVAGCINLYGGIIILWSIFYQICKVTGFKKDDAYVAYMVSGIVFIGTISIVSLPFLPLAIIYYGLLGEAAAGFVMPTASIALDGLLIVFFCGLVYWLVGKYILKIDVSPLKNAEEELTQYRNQKINKEQIIAIISLVFFMIIALMPSLMPAGPAKKLISNYGILGAACTIIIIQCMRRDKNGKPLYTFGQLVQKGVSWDIVVMFAASMPVSSALESGDTGIVTTIVSSLLPIFSNASPMVFILLCMAIFWLITQVAHNLILVIVFMPTLATIGTSLGINPYLFCLLFCMTTNCAFMTPGASAQAAMLFGNSDWISTKDAYKHCTIFAVIALLVIACVALPIGLLIF